MIDPLTVIGGVSAAVSLTDRLLNMPTQVAHCRYQPATKTLSVGLYTDSRDVVLQVSSEDFSLGGVGLIGPSLFMKDWPTDKSEIECRILVNGYVELTVRADPRNGASPKGLKIFIATAKNPRRVEAVCE